MMDISHLGFSFSAGLLAFLSPCALPLLPSYIAYYLNTENTETNLLKVIKFAVSTLLGFMVLFIIVGLLPSLALNILSLSIDYLTPFIGIILILLGIHSGWNHQIGIMNFFSINPPKKPSIKSFFIFGLGYAIASLACSLPIFLIIVFQSTSLGGPFEVLISYIFYGIGAGALIIPLTITIAYSKNYIYQNLTKILPFIKKINTIILILAGAYLILFYILK